jgi:hypothetical protein
MTNNLLVKPISETSMLGNEAAATHRKFQAQEER